MYIGIPPRSPQPFGNTGIVSAGEVAIGCIKPGARDLLDTSIRRYERYRARVGEEPSTRGFVRWLFQKSALVRGIDSRKAYEGYRKNLARIRENNRDHPKASIRNYRGSVYAFAYWFFRWSGMVEIVEQ